MKKRFFVAFIFGLVFFVPYLGSLLKWGKLPDGYGLFPSQFVAGKPGFNETLFIIAAAFVLLLSLFLLFPQLFGFKKSPPPATPEKVPLPKWFYAGLVLNGVSWLLMWLKPEPLIYLSYWSFTPLWWGFILMLDGWVYSRNKGFSLISSRTALLKFVGGCFLYNVVYV
ncbi:hypothetical protein [Hugenholtzia roseola]|uniref:hypothetical protein n=1 Tax=Hugenholtzia roseola TaxID=1002 RepID=UPI0003F72B27|nr:hypothetical protein [Hugenholtzia roseola]